MKDFLIVQGVFWLLSFIAKAGGATVPLWLTLLPTIVVGTVWGLVGIMLFIFILITVVG